MIDDGGSRNSGQDDSHQPGQARRDVLPRRRRSGGRAGKPRLLRRPKSPRQAGRSPRRACRRQSVRRGRVEQSVPIRTAYEGMGAFRFTPAADASYRLKITQPAGVANEPKLPAVSTQREIVLTRGPACFPPICPWNSTFARQARAAIGRSGLLPGRPGRRAADRRAKQPARKQIRCRSP